MNSERLFQILGLIDEDLIEEAAPAFSAAASKRQTRRIRGLAAACAALVCISSAFWLQRGGSDGIASPGETADRSGSGIAHETEPLSVEGTTFMSYAGPVFPLTLTEHTDGLTVQRNTSWDFSPGSYQDDSPRQWGATVSDCYLITNTTTEEILSIACYPVAGSFESLSSHLPSITADGIETEWTLYAGSYTGDFTHAGVEDGSTWNLNPPDSWTDYKTALDDGAYLKQAIETPPPLDQPVTVYEFSEFVLPDGAPDAATLALDCTIDPENTQILTYGFNGFWMEDNGWRRYDFFVPDGTRRGLETNHKLLIVLGEDFDNYTIQGYQDGGCDPGEELNGVSCTLTRTETTLETVMNQICGQFAQNFETDLFSNPFTLLSPEQFTNAVKELMLQHGVLAGDSTKDRYADGRLEEMVSEVLYQEQILYLAFPVVIPAGCSVEITADLWKEPSFDYGGFSSEHVGLQGYDFVTQLGSNLEFTEQKAALTNTENIEIYQQNFGFDLGNGITEVVLDPEQDHYYLEIRPKT